jgi:hypothetical protein
VKAFSRKQGSTEASDGAESPTWQQHNAGELALFMARTPVAYVEGNAHHVFADERAEMVRVGPVPRNLNLPI